MNNWLNGVLDDFFRKAIQKIGGIFEGVLRKDKIEPNGIPRNTAFYSILDSEWEDVKQSIKTQIEIKAKAYR